MQPVGLLRFGYIKKQLYLPIYSEYVKTETCTKDFIALCSPENRFYFKAIEKSWDYICNDTKKGLYFLLLK